MERRIITTQRECPARLVPTGDPVTIPAGTFVTLAQSLGGTFTVVLEGNMARIAGHDADALGFQPETLDFPDGTAHSVTEDNVHHALNSVYDPEIPVSIAELGLVYAISIEDTVVNIRMTLTAPGCGMGPVLVEEVKERVAAAPHVSKVNVELVFEPPWSREMMSEEAQLQLGVF